MVPILIPFHADSLPYSPSADNDHKCANYSLNPVQPAIVYQCVQRNEDQQQDSNLNGTYVAVEPFHLFRYVDEQVFRYNNRATKDNPLTDADRFHLALSQIAGNRLTFAEVTGKVGETAF